MGFRTWYFRRFPRAAALAFLLAAWLAGCSLGNQLAASETTTPTILAPTDTSSLLPNLTVQSVGVEVVTLAPCPEADAPLRLRIVVANSGPGKAGAFVVQVGMVQQSVQQTLEQGGRATLIFPGFEPQPTIRIDANNAVAETDETDNLIMPELSAPTLPARCVQTPTPAKNIQGPSLTMEGHQGKVWSVAFSPDGSLIASGSVDNTVRLWRSANGQLVRTMQGHQFPITTLHFMPGGAGLMTGSTDGRLRLWDVANNRLVRTLSEHSGWINAIDISADARWMASAAQDFTVRLWRLPNGIPVQVVDEGMAEVTSLGFSPDGNSLAWAEKSGTLRLRSMNGEWLGIFKGSTQPATNVGFSPDGKYLAAGYADGAIRIWSIAEVQIAQVLKSHTDAITGLHYTPDGRWLVSGSKDGTLRLWASDGGLFQFSPTVIFSGNQGAVNSLDLSPDGKLAVSGSDDGTVRLWQIPPAP